MTMLENPLVVAVLVVAVAGYVIVRRTVGEPLNPRDLAVPPLILIVLGLRDVVRGDPMTAEQMLALVAVGVAAMALGAWRAGTVRLYLRDGELWYRYRPITYLVWIVTAALGLVMRFAVYAAFALPSSAQSLYLSVGLTLAGESLVLAGRGLFHGAPFARQSRDDDATRRLIHGDMQNSLRRRVTGDSRKGT